MSGTSVASDPRVGSAIPHVGSDEALAARAADGDGQAFGAIFDRHHQGLYRYCLVLVANSQDAQDALQNTMIKVMRALPGEERQIALKPWLYRIAHNESIELLRRRRETWPLEPDLAAADVGMAEAVAARERLRVLISDLDKLSERQRQTLIMRELAGLGFSEIALALGTSAAVVRQTLYEARLSLRQMDAGREMGCERVTRGLSDGDGRVARRRDFRSHLRTCAHCRRFSEELESRERDFAAPAPLPAVAATGLLRGLFAGQGAAGGGFAGTLGGGVVKSLGTSVALKGAAAVAVVAAIGVGVADRGGLVDAGLPVGGHSQERAIRVVRPAAALFPGVQPVRSGSTHGTSVSVAKMRGADDLTTPQATGPSRSSAPEGSGAAEGNATPAGATEPDTGQVTAPGGTKPGAGPASVPLSDESPEGEAEGARHEKQLPGASEHGQQTAASHQAANHGQETAASHQAANHGQETAASHKAEPHGPEAQGQPAPASNPGSEEESAPAPSSPVVPESNGNGNGKAKGKGPPPGAGAP
jgi:RNA polymerase sigma factor (sigma-70 family)